MIKFTIDPTSILEACKDSHEEVKKYLYKTVNALGKSAETHLIEITKEELNSHQYLMFIGGREKNNIELENPEPGVSILTIKDTAVLIDNGEKIDMKTDKWLFKSPKTKTGKNGKYLAIPFEHGSTSKSTSATTKLENYLTGRIKEELDHQNKKNKHLGLPKITMSGIERDSKGQVLTGRLHTFDVFSNKKNPNWSDLPLTRLNIYQDIKKDKQGKPILNKKGEAKVARSFMTFRTASEGKPDKFWYPAPETKDFLKRTADWVEEKFYNEVVPAIFEKWKD